MVEYSKINAAKLGLSAGIMGAILVFLTTISGILGYSQASNLLASSVWDSYGYSVTWTGAFIGAVIGFIYAFVLIWIPSIMYNKFISN